MKPKSIRTNLIICMLLPTVIAFALLGGTLTVYMNNISITDGNTNMRSAAEQTADVLSQIDRWLDECGSDRAHIIEGAVYLRDMGDYGAMNEIWDGWVVSGRTPARICVEARLARPEWRVEIKVTAARKTTAA